MTASRSPQYRKIDIDVPVGWDLSYPAAGRVKFERRKGIVVQSVTFTWPSPNPPAHTVGLHQLDNGGHGAAFAAGFDSVEKAVRVAEAWADILKDPDITDYYAPSVAAVEAEGGQLVRV